MIERKDNDTISKPNSKLTSDDMIVRILLTQKEILDIQKEMLEITNKLVKQVQLCMTQNKRINDKQSILS